MTTDQTQPVYPPQTSGLAITSMVLGICSFFCWIMTGLPAVVLGIVALRKINRSQGRLTGQGMAIAGIATGAASTLLVLPIMVALLLPAVQAAREAAMRAQSMNNMRQIGIAVVNYEGREGNLPPVNGAAGSQLSWRVHILPYLEQQALYDQFHLDEPWDSEHNRTLIEKMPLVFDDPSDGLPPGRTIYLAVTGPGTAFGDGSAPQRLRDITDGTSNTIMLVEADADQAVDWTKPDDWQFDPNDPMRGLGNLRPGGFLALFADGSGRFISSQATPETVKSMMTGSGNEVIGPQ